MIGRANSGANIDIGAVTFANPVTLQAVGSTINIHSMLTGVDNGAFTLSSVWINFLGSAPAIDTESGAININGVMQLYANAALDTEESGPGKNVIIHPGR